MLDLWYKNAIIYCLDVEVFKDSDGDGVGDFHGLMERLDYLSSLGINCIWLQPFYPTPNRDDGYDVTDYYNVDPRLGTLGDFVEFVRHSRERGLRVIIDLVVNHTSIKHPWFQAARQDPNSPYRDFYIWSEEKPADADEGTIFPGVQETTWTYDEQAQAYYFHRFYHHQPDLNITNPAVRKEIYKIMGFWLELGISGFRIDAAPFLIELKGIDDAAQVSDPYEYIKEMRNLLSWRRGDALLLAEANVPMSKVSDYFGDGDKMHMLFNFAANQWMILALVRERVQPLIEALQSSPDLPEMAQWAHFVRNHDELSLDRLSEAERDEVAEVLAPNREQMWIYEQRGIRRRMPPMLKGERHLQLVYSLMMALPGTPVLRYGEEIGMGDDLSLPERNSIRTPMQWSSEQSAGFSTAPPEKLIRPVIDEGEYSYKKVNVVDQRRNLDSFLNWMERLIRTRKSCPEIGQGKWKILETQLECVLALHYQWNQGTVIVLHNLGQQGCQVTLDLSHTEASHLIDLLGDKEYKPIQDCDSYSVELEGYGYRWFRVGGDII